MRIWKSGLTDMVQYLCIIMILDSSLTVNGLHLGRSYSSTSAASDGGFYGYLRDRKVDQSASTNPSKRSSDIFSMFFDTASTEDKDSIDHMTSYLNGKTTTATEIRTPEAIVDKSSSFTAHTAGTTAEPSFLLDILTTFTNPATEPDPNKFSSTTMDSSSATAIDRLTTDLNHVTTELKLVTTYGTERSSTENFLLPRNTTTIKREDDDRVTPTSFIGANEPTTPVKLSSTSTDTPTTFSSSTMVDDHPTTVLTLNTKYTTQPTTVLERETTRATVDETSTNYETTLPSLEISTTWINLESKSTTSSYFKTTTSTTYSNFKTEPTSFPYFKTTTPNTFPQFETTSSTTIPELRTTSSTTFPDFETTSSSTFPDFQTTSSTTFPQFETTSSTTFPQFETTSSTTFPQFETTSSTTFPVVETTTSTTFPDFESTTPTTFSTPVFTSSTSQRVSDTTSSTSTETSADVAGTLEHTSSWTRVPYLNRSVRNIRSVSRTKKGNDHPKTFIDTLLSNEKNNRKYVKLPKRLISKRHKLRHNRKRK